MKRKKFLALALAGVMTAATLTACAPLDALYDWFFGGGSASRGNEKSLVTESEELEKQLEKYSVFLKPQQAPEPRRRLRKWQKDLTRHGSPRTTVERNCCKCAQIYHG